MIVEDGVELMEGQTFVGENDEGFAANLPILLR
jgi:hypothetical protein